MYEVSYAQCTCDFDELEDLTQFTTKDRAGNDNRDGLDGYPIQMGLSFYYCNGILLCLDSLSCAG